jgi:hypothetical protein
MAQIVGYFSNGSPVFKDDLTSKSVFINCDFRYSDLSELDLKSIIFFQCDFTSACFRESKFTDVEFSLCVLDSIDAYMTQFIRVVFGFVSMKSSLLTKSTFLLESWIQVDISGSKIFDMDMQETKDAGSCILDYHSEVVGEPARLLDGYFTVNSDTAWAKRLGGGVVNRITNSQIEEAISKSKTLLGFFSRALGFGRVDYFNDDYYQGLQKKLDEIRKN